MREKGRSTSLFVVSFEKQCGRREIPPHLLVKGGFDMLQPGFWSLKDICM